jgi:hypothetical protein
MCHILKLKDRKDEGIMKIIEGLKQIKDLKRKADDLKALIRDNCVLSSLDTPKYGDVAGQTKQVAEWIQAHRDIINEIMRLRIAIQRTNLVTEVIVELGGKKVSKSIAAWIHRRRDLAKEDLAAWDHLTDRGIKEGMGKSPSGEEMKVSIVRFYEPAMRDRMKDMLSSEPSLIDAKLEITNAITDLIE